MGNSLSTCKMFNMSSMFNFVKLSSEGYTGPSKPIKVSICNMFNMSRVLKMFPIARLIFSRVSGPWVLETQKMLNLPRGESLALGKC